MPASQGSQVYDMRDYGAVADGVTDCADVVQAAIDGIGPTLAQAGSYGTLYFPSAPKPYRLSRPLVVDWSYLDVRGDGPSSMLSGSGAHALLQFGVARRPGGNAFDLNHWVDLYGLVDAVAAPTPGKRWGYRTRGDAHPSFMATPLDLGPADLGYWATATTLTVEGIFHNPGGPWSTSPLGGMLDPYGKPGPFYLVVDTNQNVSPVGVTLYFQTNDGLTRAAHIQIPAAQPLLRFALQVDLAGRAITGYVGLPQGDNQQQVFQVAVDLSLVNDGWESDLRSDLKLAPNWCVPFNVGAIGPVGPGWGPIYTAQDITCCALKLSNALLYQDQGVGKPQARIDGGPVHDGRLYSPEAATVALLPMDRPPAGDLLLPWRSGAAGGDVSGYGLFLPPLTVHDTRGGNGVRDLQLLGASPSYGQTVSTGFVYDFQIERCLVQHGAHGLGGLNFGANYPLNVRDSQFVSNNDAALYNYFGILWLNRLTLKYYGRSAVKCYRSELIVRDLFCTDSDNAVSTFRLIQPGSGSFENVTADFEGNPAPTDSHFWADLGSDNGGQTALVLRRFRCGTVPAGVPYVRLVSKNLNGGLMNDHIGPAWLLLEDSFNLSTSSGLAVVAVDGPAWQGKFVGLPPSNLPLVVNTFTPGGSARFGVEATPAPVVPGPVAGFSVAHLPGLIGWYRAQDLGLVCGDRVTSWPDLSPKGNHATAGGTSPVFVAGAVNGLAAVRFAGAGYLGLGNLAGSTGSATCFFVTRGGVDRLFFTIADVQDLRCEAGAWQLTGSAPSVAAASATHFAVYAVRVTGPTPVISVWANNCRVGHARTNAPSRVRWSGATLGAGELGSTPAYFTGDVCEVIIVDGGLDGQAVGDTIQYLMNEYGLFV